MLPAENDGWELDFCPVHEAAVSMLDYLRDLLRRGRAHHRRLEVIVGTAEGDIF